MYESGYYNGEVVWQGFGASKQKETPSFDLQFKIKERFDPVTQELSPVTEGSVQSISTYLMPLCSREVLHTKPLRC